MLRGHMTLFLLIRTHGQNPPVLKSQLPKPIVSKTVVKPTVGIVKSSVTTTSNKTITHSGRVIKPPTKLNL